jgi:hypothetical protein
MRGMGNSSMQLEMGRDEGCCFALASSAEQLAEARNSQTKLLFSKPLAQAIRRPTFTWAEAAAGGMKNRRTWP